MMTYKQKQLVEAVQGAMGARFHVSVVNAEGNSDGSLYQLEAVDLRSATDRARSRPYPLNSETPLSELAGLCSNRLKVQLQTSIAGPMQEKARLIW